MDEEKDSQHNVSIFSNEGHGGGAVTGIRMVGRTHIVTTLADGEGMRRVSDFLSCLATGFSRLVARYMRQTWEAPFVFRERQLNTFLAPVLHQLCDVFLMEAPVNRNWSSISQTEYLDSHGWVDFWCYYRNLVLLMELKHEFVSVRSRKPNLRVIQQWEQAVEQLEVIQEYARDQAQHYNGAFRIAFQVLPVFESTNHRLARYVQDAEKLVALQNRCIEELTPQPNWSLLWMLHESIVGPFHYEHRTEYYPGVLFQAWVSEIHKGGRKAN